MRRARAPESQRPPAPRRMGRVVLALLFAACSPAPPTSPPASAVTQTASAAPSAAGSTVPLAEPALADELRAALNPDVILADLATIQELSGGADGRRNAGSEAYAAVARFVAGELEAAGYAVTQPPVALPLFRQDAPTVLEIVDGQAFDDIHEVKAMLFSASGDATGPVVPLGFDPGASPGAPTGLGCQASDWAEVPKGAIALVQPAPCRRQDVIVNAQEAGAAAVITSYVDWQRDHVLRPTLIDPTSISIPAVGVTHEVGLALADAAASDAEVHVETHTSFESTTSPSVIAESPGGDPAHVLMLGGHLDSVMDGPGINDNASGTMTVLEIARQLATLSGGPGVAGGGGWRVRVAFWSGEELGLFGSFAYTEELGSEADAIEAYLNFDMIGSKNGVRQVYDGAATTSPEESGAVMDLFARALDDAGLAWEPIAVGAASDHFPFDQVGVPIGGLFSGANELKTAEQVATFGGTAGAQQDPCYHLGCDTVDNIDPVRLEELARAAAWVTGALASGEVTLGTS